MKSTHTLLIGFFISCSAWAQLDLRLAVGPTRGNYTVKCYTEADSLAMQREEQQLIDYLENVIARGTTENLHTITYDQRILKQYITSPFNQLQLFENMANKQLLRGTDITSGKEIDLSSLSAKLVYHVGYNVDQNLWKQELLGILYLEGATGNETPLVFAGVRPKSFTEVKITSGAYPSLRKSSLFAQSDYNYMVHIPLDANRPTRMWAQSQLNTPVGNFCFDINNYDFTRLVGTSQGPIPMAETLQRVVTVEMEDEYGDTVIEEQTIEVPTSHLYPILQFTYAGNTTPSIMVSEVWGYHFLESSITPWLPTEQYPFIMDE